VLELRDGQPADYDAYARLANELGIDDPIPSRERFVSELVARTIVAVDAGEVIGYLLFEHLAGVGYIRNVVSDPRRRRTGIGRALMDAARARFVGAGATTWCLNVKESNAAAIALYESFGMRVEYLTTVMRLPRAVEVPPPSADHALAPLPPEADATVEPRLRLLPGQLASARRRPSRSVLQLSHRGEVVGACVFMPSVPGAFPFRVVDPAHAAAFIALLRAHHVPDGAAFVQVSAEADAPLATEVRRLGARVYLDLAHLGGPLVP